MLSPSRTYPNKVISVQFQHLFQISIAVKILGLHNTDKSEN